MYTIHVVIVVSVRYPALTDDSIELLLNRQCLSGSPRQIRPVAC